MKIAIRPLVVIVILLSGCNQASDQRDLITAQKAEGPPIKSLSHAELMEIYADCTKYGRMDDPKVHYTPRYCSAINGAQEVEGYSATTPRKIDPNPVRLR